MLMLYYMKPCCQQIAMRWKYFVHVSNLWTCMTTIWAIVVEIDHNNWTIHLYIAATGWAIIFVWWLIVIRKLDKNDVLNAAVDEPTTHPRACAEIMELRTYIGYSQRQHVWGIHAAILRLLEFATHEDEAVRLKAFETFAILSFWDHVTARKFFIEFTPNTAMQIVLNAITSEQDESLRIFAVRVLGAFVRSDLHIKQLNWYIENDNEVDVAASIARMARATVRPEARVDCMQTLLAMTYIDSNVLDAIADDCIPLLGEWAQKGSLIEQHLAAELFMLVSGRFDLTADLIANGALPKLVSLFMAVDDIEVKPETLKANETDGFRPGCMQPQHAIMYAHQTPLRVRKNFQKMYRRVKHIYQDQDSFQMANTPGAVTEAGDEEQKKVKRQESTDTQQMQMHSGSCRASSWAAWCNCGAPLAIEIKKKLVDQGFKGVSKVRSTGVTRAHLEELFAVMYETRDRTLDTAATSGFLDGAVIAAYLAKNGLGEKEDIEEIMLETSLYQHGIGEVDDTTIDERLPKDVFSQWLVMSRPENQDGQSPRELVGDSLAFRVMRECIPTFRDADYDLNKLERAVNKLYDDIFARYRDTYSGADALVLHKTDLASYLTEEREMYGGTVEQLIADIDTEISRGKTDTDARVQLSALQVQIMKDEITQATVQTLTEIAIAQGAQGRSDMVDGGALVIISRCFGLFKPPDVHILALNMLHALMNGRFSENDISHDGDLMGFYSEIQEFNVKLDREPSMAPILQFERLSAVQRRKAHMMAAFLGMYHRSIGSPVNRTVVVSRQPITKALVAKIWVEAEGAVPDQADGEDDADTEPPLIYNANRQSQKDVVFVNPMTSNDEGDADGVDKVDPQYVNVDGSNGPLDLVKPLVLDDETSGMPESVSNGSQSPGSYRDSTTSLQQLQEVEALAEDETVFEASRENIAKTGIIAAVRGLCDTGCPKCHDSVANLSVYSQLMTIHAVCAALEVG